MISRVNSFRMVTAKQIRLTREKLQENRGTFAKRFGVSRPTIYNWENEKRGPPQTSYAQHFITEKLAGMGFEYAQKKRGGA
jgi:DNA-binding XRE family transcriptional regulator